MSERRRGPLPKKVAVSPRVKVSAPVDDRLVDLGVHVDEEGRYRLRYKIDLPGIAAEARGFVAKLAGQGAGSLFDTLLGRKDEEDE